MPTKPKGTKHLRAIVPTDVTDKVVAQQKLLQLKSPKNISIDEALTLLVRNATLVH